MRRLGGGEERGDAMIGAVLLPLGHHLVIREECKLINLFKKLIICYSVKSFLFIEKCNLILLGS